MVSLIVKTLGHIPQASLGASGAIMGLVGYTCEKFPNSQFSIIFAPNYTFTGDTARDFILTFDMLGLIVGAASRWKFIVFDHAGHLGGMLFGIWYAKVGEVILNQCHRFIVHLVTKK